MHIQLNGKQKSLPVPTTLSDLLKEFNLLAERVVIEINQNAIIRESFGTTTVAEGDTVEILEFVGGG